MRLAILDALEKKYEADIAPPDRDWETAATFSNF